MSSDLPPIRCITCNTVLASRWNDYNHLIENGTSIEDALNAVGLYRICCRIRLMNPFKYVEKVSNDSNLYEIHDTTHSAKNLKIDTLKSKKIIENTPAPLDIEFDVPVLQISKPSQNPRTKVYKAW